MGSIAVIDYGAGNSMSVLYALKRLGISAQFTADTDIIRRADKVIFPGVGNAGSAMRKLKTAALDRLIPELTQPVLGVCLGLQLMCRSSSEEHTSGLQLFDVEVNGFDSRSVDMKGLKIPHMGWNVVHAQNSLLLQGIPDQSYFYFVHGYYAGVISETKGITRYGIPFSAVIEKDNFFATQFHPEKSGEPGVQVLKNFLAL